MKEVCARLKVNVHTCWGSTLYHRDDVPFPHMSRFERIDCFHLISVNLLKIYNGVSSDRIRLPDVYTQFRKAVENQSRVRPVFPTPVRLHPLPPGLEEGAIPTAEDLQQTGD